MPLDQVANFIQVLVSGTHASGDSTVSLQSGEASKLPDLTGGKYNLVWFDSQNFRSPDTDPNVEIVRVNSIDTTNDTISVTRGVEDTSASAKNTSGATYELFLGTTAKTITDIDSQKLDQNNRYSDSEATSAVESHSFTDLDTGAIINDSTTHLSLDGTGNVNITNGELDLLAGDITITKDKPTINVASSSNSNSANARLAGGSNELFQITAQESGMEMQLTTNGASSSNVGISINDSQQVTIPSGDLTDGTNIIYDQSASEIPDSAMGSIANSTLTNSSVTIEGNSVSLGGSTSINHNDLSTISSNDHHSKTTSASALTDVSPDSTTNAHHSKTSSASELTDVSADSASSAHHSKTSSASELTDVSPDSTSNAHHSRYSDSEARSAVESNVSRVGGSGLFLDFDNDSNYIELVDGSNNRDNLVTEDVYINQTNEWLGDDHLGVSNAHHSKYTDSNARTAVDGSNVSVSGSSGSVLTSNFEIVENTSTNSLDFNYTG